MSILHIDFKKWNNFVKAHKSFVAFYYDKIDQKNYEYYVQLSTSLKILKGVKLGQMDWEFKKKAPDIINPNQNDMVFLIVEGKVKWKAKYPSPTEIYDHYKAEALEMNLKNIQLV